MQDHIPVDLLEVLDLRVYFFLRRGIVKAVDGVSFSIKKGKSLGLVGESGCGKSVTALSMLRLLPQPPALIVGGKILFEGHDLVQKTEREMREVRGRKLSMILQDPLTSLNPVYTIGNQVAEALQTHQSIRGKNVRDRILEMLRAVRIPAAEDRVRDYPHQMSGGMRQRVAGAICLSCAPSLLIADEPTTSLDTSTQAQYLDLLKELQENQHLSLLFITHNFGLVAKMCDSVAVMYAGKIVERCAVKDLFDSPRHPYSVALMGAIPRLGWKVERLSSIAGEPPVPINLPPGCSFAPRCRHAEEICKRESPPLVAVSDGHYVTCWIGQK